MQKMEILQQLKKSKSNKKMTMNDISVQSYVGIRTVNRIFSGEDVRFSSMVAVLDALDIDLHAHIKIAG